VLTNKILNLLDEIENDIFNKIEYVSVCVAFEALRDLKDAVIDAREDLDESP
jgi:hypothetical protein